MEGSRSLEISGSVTDRYAAELQTNYTWNFSFAANDPDGFTCGKYAADEACVCYADFMEILVRRGKK